MKLEQTKFIQISKENLDKTSLKLMKVNQDAVSIEDRVTKLEIANFNMQDYKVELEKKIIDIKI